MADPNGNATWTRWILGIILTCAGGGFGFSIKQATDLAAVKQQVIDGAARSTEDRQLLRDDLDRHYADLSSRLDRLSMAMQAIAGDAVYQQQLQRERQLMRQGLGRVPVFGTK